MHETVRDDPAARARPGWFALAFRRSVVRRALRTAALVGCVLIAINHGDALLAGDVDAGRLARMLLTLLVPYLVSTTSSVAAMREHAHPAD